MIHLGFGAIGGAVATAIMCASSLATIGQQLAGAGIKMLLADQKILNGGVLDSQATRAILSGYNAEYVTEIQGAVTEGFIQGLNLAYWAALVSAMLGILAVTAIDEKGLRKVDE